MELELLGTVHSHPDVRPDPSECDNDVARDWGEKIFGTYEITKREGKRFRTGCKWWPKHHPVESVSLRD
ncbi:MAG TPA: Mov34/MPN/PAD-1 family protein [Bryobacteraceae bacterium]|nr:Mov34/MPN/PAD-1 family protein [Bryobacteraceae bacterium]